MSVSSEISRLQTAKANIKTALENKGVEVSASAKLDAYPTYIDNIPSGGDDSFIKTLSKSDFTGTSFMSVNTYIYEVDIPSGVTTIVAVGGLSNLTACTIPNTVRTINYLAFANCSKLPTVDIPNSVTSIGMSAFTNCTSLTNIEIPSGVTSLSKAMFQNCTRLSGVTLNSGLTSIDDYVFSGCTSLTTGITIPNTVTSIGQGAFTQCRYLRNINIPSGVTSIRPELFYNNNLLEKVNSNTVGECNIPSGVTSIGLSAFCYCYKIKNIDIPDSVTTISGHSFYNCSGLTSCTIGSAVTNIDTCAFEGCKSLKSYVIPNSVTQLGAGTHRGCTSLSSVTIGSGVTRLPNGNFDGCTNLQSVNIPSGVTIIGPAVFRNCSSLTSIEIPSAVTEIYSEAFNYCSGLTAITINATTPPTLNNKTAFMYTNNCPIYVPAESVNAYKAATNWNYFESRIQAIPTPSNWIVLNQYDFIPEGTYSNLRIHSATTINDGEHITICDGVTCHYIGSYCTDTEHEEYDCESFDVGYCQGDTQVFDPEMSTLEPFTFGSDGYWYLNTEFDSDGMLEAPFELEVLEAESNGE